MTRRADRQLEALRRAYNATRVFREALDDLAGDLGDHELNEEQEEELEAFVRDLELSASCPNAHDVNDLHLAHLVSLLRSLNPL